MIHSSCDVFPRGIHDDYRFLLIKRPGSLVLSETKFPCASRVVSNLSLVRPANWFWSSRITADSSLKPVVTEPMIRRLPSRMYFFSSDTVPSLSSLAIYKADGGNDYL